MAVNRTAPLHSTFIFSCEWNKILMLSLFSTNVDVATIRFNCCHFWSFLSELFVCLLSLNVWMWRMCNCSNWSSAQSFVWFSSNYFQLFAGCNLWPRKMWGAEDKLQPCILPKLCSGHPNIPRGCGKCCECVSIGILIIDNDIRFAAAECFGVFCMKDSVAFLVLFYLILSTKQTYKT